MRHLLLLLAFALTASAQTTKVIGVANLQDYWPMQEGTGTTTADKVSGGTAGTLTSTSWTTGLFGNCLLFNGTTSQVDFGTAFRPAVAQPWSVSFWFFDTSVAGLIVGIVSNLDTTGAIGLEMGIFATSNKLYCFVGSGATNLRRFDSTVAVTGSVWHHAVGTWDGSACKVYLDGVLGASGQTAGTVAAITYSNDLFLGRHAYVGSNFFTGKVDDLKTYFHAMTQSEVNYLFYSGRMGSR